MKNEQKRKKAFLAAQQLPGANPTTFECTATTPAL
jgi:hypothetical protein